MEDKLQKIIYNHYSPLWNPEMCEWVAKLKPKLQLILIKYARTGKI